MRSSCEAFSSPRRTNACVARDAATPIMRMPRRPVCSKAYSRSGFARRVPLRTAPANAAGHAMCGSTQWPRSGLSIIERRRCRILSASLRSCRKTARRASGWRAAELGARRARRPCCVAAACAAAPADRCRFPAVDRPSGAPPCCRGRRRRVRQRRYGVVTNTIAPRAPDVSCWRRVGHAITDRRNSLSGFFPRFRRESRAMRARMLQKSSICH